jgi:hypothetical protein
MNFERISQKDPKGLKEPKERRDWADALVSLWALELLLGQEKLALKHLQRCQKYCEEWLPGDFWKEPRDWACSKRPQLVFCGGPKR